MQKLTGLLQAGKASFHQVATSFLDQPGLPFADALSAADIQQAFAERNALFATHATFSTPIVLWAFLAQALKDGKGVACAAAVADIATYMQQVGGPVPSGDTGDYCRARAKLDLEALRRLTVQTAGRLESQADSSWLFHGLHPKLIDGFTFTMPDTDDNQKQFPQQRTQRPGAGFPIARVCVVLSLATAAVQDMNIGPYEGKQTGESALLRGIEEQYEPIPETMTLRQVRFQVTEPGKRTEELVVVTSRTDPQEHPAEAIAALYGYRMIKRDRQHYPMMHDPRRELRKRRCMT
jgi:hypothetical protein